MGCLSDVFDIYRRKYQAGCGTGSSTRIRERCSVDDCGCKLDSHGRLNGCAVLREREISSPPSRSPVWTGALKSRLPDRGSSLCAQASIRAGHFSFASKFKIMARKAGLCTIAALFLIHTCCAFPNGGPIDACIKSKPNQPNHGSVQPQPDETNPYIIEASSDYYRPGDKITGKLHCYFSRYPLLLTFLNVSDNLRT